MSVPLRTRVERGIARTIATFTRNRPEALRLYLDGLPLEVDSFLRGYLLGYYPFPDSDGVLRWRAPEERGVILVDEFKIPKKARASVRKQNYKIRIDHDVMAVLDACAEPTKRRPETWLTDELRAIYAALNEMGLLHSVEAWKDGELVGGEFGLAIGGYFSSESAFSRQRDASKVTLIYLHRELAAAGFDLIDVQHVNDYIKPFGARVMARDEFRERQLRALVKPCRFGQGSEGSKSSSTTVPPFEL